MHKHNYQAKFVVGALTTIGISIKLLCMERFSYIFLKFFLAYCVSAIANILVDSIAPDITID